MLTDEEDDDRDEKIFFCILGWAVPFTSVVLFLWNTTHGYFPLSLVFLSFIIFTTDFYRLDEFHRKCSHFVNLETPTNRK